MSLLKTILKITAGQIDLPITYYTWKLLKIVVKKYLRLMVKPWRVKIIQRVMNIYRMFEVGFGWFMLDSLWIGCLNYSNRVNKTRLDHYVQF